MNLDLSSKIFTNSTLLVLAIYFPLITYYEKSSNVILIIFISAILWLIFSREKTLYTKYDSFLFFSFTGYFLYVLLSNLYHGESIREIDFASRFILVIPIYFFFKNHRLNLEVVFIGIAIAAILSALNYVFGHFGPWLYEWQTNRGMTASFCGLFSLLSLSQISKNNSKLKNAFYLFAGVSGIYAMLYAGGRGVWIAFSLSLIALIFLTKEISKIKKIMLVVGVLTSFAFSYFLLPDHTVKYRVNLAVDSFSAYFQNDNQLSSTSVFQRMEMYKGAYLIFKDNPLLGIGKTEYKKKIESLVQDKQLHTTVKNFNHPHNEFVSNVIFYGLLSLIPLLFVLVTPLYYALKKKRKEFSSAGIDNALIIVASFYIFYSLTNAVFAHRRTILFFALLTAVLVGAKSSLESRGD